MAKANFWYVRQNKEIRGPFPAGMISRYILLGRIDLSDELSNDQHKWQLVSDLPQLIPSELTANLDLPENRERLRVARLREDERQTGDRRLEFDGAGDRAGGNAHLKRSGEERRGIESSRTVKHREIKTEFRQSLKQPTGTYTLRGTLLVVFVVSIVILAVNYSPERKFAVNICDAPAAPYVNWNNCFFEGAKLAQLDLTGANLSNASLTGADMRGTSLKGARLDYSNLANSQLQRANLHNAHMVGTILRNGNFVGANFSNVNLRYAIFQGANLTDANFTNADLTHVVFNGAILSKTIFDGAKLGQAIWVDNSVCAPESIGRCIPVKRADKK